MLKEILVAGTNTSQRKCVTDFYSAADPDLQIRGGGRSQKNFFRPFGPQFGLKIMGCPGPSPGSATVIQMNNHTA